MLYLYISLQLPDRLGMQTMTSTLRQRLATDSSQLQDTETLYISQRQQLLNVEAEVASSLQLVGGDEGLDYQDLLKEAQFRTVQVY